MMRTGDALRYIREIYGVPISNPTLVRFIKIGRLRGAQPGGPRAWWVVSKQSIDELFGSSTSEQPDQGEAHPPP